MATGWVTWLPLVVAAAVGLAVCAVLFDVSGVGGRLVPGHRAFVARLPRALERLWRGTVLVAVGEPYVEAPEQAPYAEPAPAAVTASYRTFCGT